MGRMTFLTLLLFLISTLSPVVMAQGTEQIFAQWKDRVIQVQVMDQAAGSKAGIGSGFFAGRQDWVVTNYHVIASLVNEPGRYAARYVANDGQEGSLELLAVDAVHDLALLRTDGLERTPLGVAAAEPRGGARLWSMGFPFDIGMTIVEGTYNGHLRNSMYDKLHFTGSINPGMSGGPTLDGNGQVVGVNVSTAGNQVSFLVPVRHVMDLLAHESEAPATTDELNDMVASQLLENQQALVDQTLADELPLAQLKTYEVPSGLAEFVNCWGNSEEDEENRLELVYLACQTRDDIYLSGTLNTGIIQFQHDVVSTDALEPLRFYRQLEVRNYYPRLRLDGDETTVSNYRCQSGFVDDGKLPMKVTYCVRSYLKLDGLYDAYLTSTSLVDESEALQSTLVLAGFSWENLEQFTRRFLGALAWSP